MGHDLNSSSYYMALWTKHPILSYVEYLCGGRYNFAKEYSKVDFLYCPCLPKATVPTLVISELSTVLLGS